MGMLTIQEKVLESIIDTQKHILILSQDIIIQTLKNETLDDLKKMVIDIKVPENYASILKKGLRVEILSSSGTIDFGEICSVTMLKS